MDLVHAGTTGDPARSQHQVLPRLPIAAVALSSVVAAIVAASLIATSMSSSASEGVRSFADSSYDQVERIRGAVAVPAGPIDTSYETVERIRGAISLPEGTVDDSYDRVERARLAGPGR